jgi:DNA polymerase III subunit epsilon
MRQIILDTETTGLSWEKGNRIVEIGCVELINRRPSGRTYQQYLNPEREMEMGAMEVTGLTRDFLSDKPVFSAVVDDFLAFIKDAELVIHNAEFDMGFINNELNMLGASYTNALQQTNVLDTLKLARNLYPGQRNSLDALCKRLGVENKHRQLHGALLDAELLSDVYLMMTSGQTGFGFDQAELKEQNDFSIVVLPGVHCAAYVLQANEAECQEHTKRMFSIAKKSGKTNWPD